MSDYAIVQRDIIQQINGLRNLFPNFVNLPVKKEPVPPMAEKKDRVSSVVKPKVYRRPVRTTD